MTEKEYYEIMCETIYKYKSFKKVHELWYKCFIYGMGKLKISKSAANNLFYNFLMNNWTALHKEKTEYKDYSTSQLLESFKGECHYISDRLSFDRIFRAHWLFLQVYNSQMDKIRYSNIYKK